MKQNYNYRVEIKDEENVSMSVGTITTYCSGTTSTCSGSSKCKECIDGTHNGYIKMHNSTGYSGSKMCLKCYTWSDPGASYIEYSCTKCNPLGSSYGTGSTGYWAVPKRCSNCGLTYEEQIKRVNHTCPTCSGHGYSKCSTHNKYGAHYYCSHTTTGQKHS